MIGTPTATIKRWRTWRPKRVEFVSAGPLADVLGGAGDAERIFLVGPRPAGPEAFAAWRSALPEGWSPDPSGHYLENLDQFVLRLRHSSGRRVEVHRAGAWFGDDAPYTPGQARAAYDTLGRTIGAVFPGGTLLATPATTGRDLFVRSIPADVSYPVAPAEVQAKIRRTSGQGRIELFPHERLPGLAEYDGRLMYSALCWGLGSGCASWDRAPFEFEPYARARYRIQFRVPAGWSHVGLLPVWDRDHWFYPADPGGVYDTWADGAEVLIAHREGWSYRLAERILLHPPAGAGPLAGWAKKLSVARESLRERGEHLAANGARAIILHAIGAFNGAPHYITRSVPADTPRAVSPDAGNLRLEGEYLVWSERRPPAWPELCHPEWSAAIWARCRARLLSGPLDTGALHVPAGDVVAFRTDAIYLTSRQQWVDDGKAGRLRLRSWLPGPVPGPVTPADLLQLRKAARHG